MDILIPSTAESGRLYSTSHLRTILGSSYTLESGSGRGKNLTKIMRDEGVSEDILKRTELQEGSSLDVFFDRRIVEWIGRPPSWKDVMTTDVEEAIDMAWPRMQIVAFERITAMDDLLASLNWNKKTTPGTWFIPGSGSSRKNARLRRIQSFRNWLEDVFQASRPKSIRRSAGGAEIADILTRHFMQQIVFPEREWRIPAVLAPGCPVWMVRHDFGQPDAGIHMGRIEAVTLKLSRRLFSEGSEEIFGDGSLPFGMNAGLECNDKYDLVPEYAGRVIVETPDRRLQEHPFRICIAADGGTSLHMHWDGSLFKTRFFIAPKADAESYFQDRIRAEKIRLVAIESGIVPGEPISEPGDYPFSESDRAEDEPCSTNSAHATNLDHEGILQGMDQGAKPS